MSCFPSVNVVDYNIDNHNRRVYYIAIARNAEIKRGRSNPAHFFWELYTVLDRAKPYLPFCRALPYSSFTRLSVMQHWLSQGRFSMLRIASIAPPRLA